MLGVAEDNFGKIRNSRYTRLGLGLDGSDAKKGAAGWRKSFIGLGFALGRENCEESGIGCQRGVRLGDSARKEMEEDADLRAPHVRERGGRTAGGVLGRSRVLAFLSVTTKNIP